MGRVTRLSFEEGNMSSFTRRELIRTAVISGVLGLMGLVMVLATRAGTEPENFWHPYVVAIGGIGLMMLLFGFVWFALSAGHLFTTFFDTRRSMDSGTFAGTIAAIFVAVGVLLVVVLPRLPATPVSRLPPDPKDRIPIVRMESNFKLLVALGILASGAALASVPFRRFFRK